MDIHEKELLQERWPFLTLITYLNNDYLGIVQHSDSAYIHMYVIDNTFSEKMRSEFIDCGEAWWWGSNRSIPINLFLQSKFSIFKKYLRSFSTKDSKLICGPTVNIRNLINKRTKRRTIQLVHSVK